MTMPRFEILCGDSRKKLRELPGSHFQACITSPPYLGQRLYRGDVERQIGIKQTVGEYIGSLVEVFDGVRNVLHPSGTLWVVLGDAYAGGGHGSAGKSSVTRGYSREMQEQAQGFVNRQVLLTDSMKPKDLMGLPYRLAFALQEAGWYWRSIITWAKKSCKPEAVRDRPSVTTERVLVFSPEDEFYCDEVVLLFSRRRQYFYDQESVRQPYAESSISRAGRRWNGERQRGYPGAAVGFEIGKLDPSEGRNRGDVWKDGDLVGEWDALPVWNLATSASKDGHYAVYPEHLVAPMILAATSEQGCCPACRAPWRRVVERGEDPTREEGRAHEQGEETQPGNVRIKRQPFGCGAPRATAGWEPTCRCGIEEAIPCRVLDPFSGTATTGAAALKLGRHYTGLDQSEEYCEIGRNRLRRVEEELGVLTVKDVEGTDSAVQLGMFASCVRDHENLRSQ